MTYEEFKQNFLPEFLNIKSFAGKMKYANERLSRIGSSTGRVVYDIDGEKVLKLAKNPKGIAQNEAEAGAGYYRDTHDVVAIVFDSAENDEWLIAEKGKKVNEPRIIQLTGIPSLNELWHYVKNFDSENHGRGEIFHQDPEMKQQLIDNEWVQEIVNFIANYAQHPGDYGRPSSFGEVLRDGQPAIVLTDYGLNDEVYDTHYKPKRDKYGMYELYNFADGNDDMLSDMPPQDAVDTRQAMWGLMPYSVGDGPYVTNEGFISFILDRDKYPTRELPSAPYIVDEFHNVVNGLKETLDHVDNKKKFYNNLLELQDYLIRRKFWDREPLEKEMVELHETTARVQPMQLGKEYADGIANALAEKLNLGTPDYLGGGGYGHAYLINGNRVLKLTSDVCEIDTGLKIQRAKPKTLVGIYNVYKVTDTENGIAVYALIEDYIANKPHAEFVRYTDIINSLGDDLYGRLLRILIKGNAKKADVEFAGKTLNDFPELAKLVLTSKPDANINQTDRQKAYEFIMGLYAIKLDLIRLAIDSVDFMTISNLGYKDNVLIYYDIGGCRAKEPQLPPENQITLPEAEEVLLDEDVTGVPREVSDKIANVVTQKFNYSQPKYVGEGVFGYAYDIGNNMILKVTKDQSEANENLALMGKPLKYIAEPYKVFSVKPTVTEKELYVIILEKLQTDPAKFRAIKDRMDFAFKRIMQTDYPDVVDYYVNGPQPGLDVDEEKVEKYMARNPQDAEFFNSVVKIGEEAKKYGVESMDYVNTTNLGYKPDGSLAFFDVGFGNYFFKADTQPEEIQVNEDGTSKFSTSDGIGRDNFPAYNNDDDSPMTDNNIPVNINISEEKWAGKAYRVESNLLIGGKTAGDVVRFERDELGNVGDFAHITDEKLRELDNYSAKNIAWVTKTFEDAKRYSETPDFSDIDEFELSGEIIATDGDGGYLVLNNQLQEDLEYHHVVGDATDDKYELDERIKSAMPGSTGVEIKKKCRLGGLGNTSAQCNWGDINAVKMKKIDEVAGNSTKDFWAWVSPDNQVIKVPYLDHRDFIERKYPEYRNNPDELFNVAFRDGWVRVTYEYNPSRFQGSLALNGYDKGRVKWVLKNLFFDLVKYGDNTIYVDYEEPSSKEPYTTPDNSLSFSTRDSEGKAKLINFISEAIDASEAYASDKAIKSVLSGKRDVGFTELNQDNIKFIEKNGLHVIPVRLTLHHNIVGIIYRDKVKADRLYEIAKSKGGYLKDSSPEEAREIGGLLGYKEASIEEYIRRKYGNKIPTAPEPNDFDNIDEVSVKSNEKEEIYRDNNYIVIRPLTHYAARKYGCDTNWCTSVSNPMYFDSHSKGKNFLLYVINRNAKPESLQKRNEKINYFSKLYSSGVWDNLPDEEKEKLLNYSRIAISIEYLDGDDNPPDITIFDANDFDIYEFTGEYGNISILPIPENVKIAIDNYIDKETRGDETPNDTNRTSYANAEMNEENSQYDKQIEKDVTTHGLNAKYVRTYKDADDTVDVYTVNGDEMRDSGFIEWVDGGNHWVDADLPKAEQKYAKHIPKDKIVVDDVFVKKPIDFEGILLHERTESYIIKHFGYEYDDAHVIANKIELMFRKKSVSENITTDEDAERLASLMYVAFKKHFRGNKKHHKFLNEDVADTYAQKQFGIEPPHQGFEDKFARDQQEDVVYSDPNSDLVVIRNPKRLDSIFGYARGVIDPEGNLYIEQRPTGIHFDMLYELNKLGLVKDEVDWDTKLPTNFVTVQRYLRSNKILLGESNFAMIPDEDRPTDSRTWQNIPSYEEAEPVYQRFLDRAKQKTLIFEFINMPLNRYVKQFERGGDDDNAPIFENKFSGNNKYYRAVSEFMGDEVEFEPNGYYEAVGDDGYPVMKYDTFWMSNKPEIAASKSTGGAVMGIYSMMKYHGSIENYIYLYEINEKPDVDISHWSYGDFEFLQEVRYRRPVKGKYVGKVAITDDMKKKFDAYYNLQGLDAYDEPDEESLEIAQDTNYNQYLAGVDSMVHENMMNEELMSLQDLPFKQEVEQAGGKIFSVGGAVRDEFLGKQSKDLDVLITGVPFEQLEQILSKYGRVDAVGKSFGVLKFKPKGATEDIDIAIPRTETPTGEGGHQGFDVKSDHALPIEKDLERRDFTINAIAKDSEGNIVDPYGGQEDLKNKIIRIVNPQAFSDDPLRMLRAVQFASRFGFTIEPETMRMIKENASRVKEIAPERILTEFDKIIKKGNVITGVELLMNSGLYSQIFGNGKPKKISGLFSHVGTMGEFIFLLAKGTVESPAEFYKDNLKGDIPTYKEIKALELAFSEGDINNPIMARSIAHNMYLSSPQALLSQIIPKPLQIASQELLQGKYPKTVNELAVNGDDLMKLGLQGKAIGDMQKSLLLKIYADKVKNSREDLLKLAGQKSNGITEYFEYPELRGEANPTWNVNGKNVNINFFVDQYYQWNQGAYDTTTTKSVQEFLDNNYENFSNDEKLKHDLYHKLVDNEILDEDMIGRVSYSAVVLDKNARFRLVERFKKYIPENFEIIAHHMTINMGEIDPEYAKYLGMSVDLTVEEIAMDDMVVAVGVNGFHSKNTKPHITLAVNTFAGGKPKMSNNLTNWEKVKRPLTITGVVTEVGYR